MNKRKSCRAVVFIDNKLVTMKRIKDGRLYYTFAGGGLEEGESHSTCVIRECVEEFGINVEPIRHLYTYENDKTIQYFYLCKYTSGKFGSGVGEEFMEDRNKGEYEPTLMSIGDILSLPLMPPEIAKAVAEDGKDFYNNYNEDVKVFVV